jgi:hypothetical protein
MLLVCLLVISLVLLFAFSMTRGKGKNTKFARKGAKSMAPKRKTAQTINTSEVVEIN